MIKRKAPADGASPALFSLPRSRLSSGLSPFHSCLGYQLPLFAAQEEDVGVPAAEAFIQRAWHVWKKAQSTLLWAPVGLKHHADRRLSDAPHYLGGQKFWLSTQDIPLRVDAPKMNPRFIGPYIIAKMISQSAVHLNLPATLRCINPTFHVSRVKPFITEPPSCSLKPPPLVDWWMGLRPSPCAGCWTFITGVRLSSTWWIGRDTDPERCCWVCAGPDIPH